VGDASPEAEEAEVHEEDVGGGQKRYGEGKAVTTSISLDIKPGWLNVARRLQSVSRKQAGYAVVSIRVLVNADGEPLLWNDPTVTRLEPLRAAEQFLSDLLTKVGRG